MKKKPVQFKKKTLLESASDFLHVSNVSRAVSLWDCGGCVFYIGHPLSYTKQPVLIHNKVEINK